MRYTKLLITAGLLAAVFTACKRDNPGGGSPHAYREPKLPANKYDYSARAVELTNNQVAVDNDIATLGRVLFYEGALSVNGLISCGSCHHQNKAFSDGQRFSTGFEFKTTTRNSPAITNPGNMSGFFWDARADNLEAMVLMPVANHVEMGMENMDYVSAKIQALPYYKDLFVNAYNDSVVNKTRIAKALTHFLASMVSVDSKFDEGEITNYTNFTEQEKLGHTLFTGLGCEGCHRTSNLSWWGGERLENIGLDEEYEDNGVFDIDPQKQAFNRGVFKTPSLRNVELTGPYMHDGRFATLEEVVEHYSSGIKPHASLSGMLRNASLQWINQSLPAHLQRTSTGDGMAPIQFNFNEQEKQALVAFLKTLTDRTYINHPMYSDPFAH